MYVLLYTLLYTDEVIWFMSATVRIRKETHQVLRELAQRRGVPMTQLLEEAAEHLRRQDLLRRINEDYARLHEDPQAWAEELEERRLWEATLADGLEDDEWIE